MRAGVRLSASTHGQEAEGRRVPRRPKSENLRLRTLLDFGFEFLSNFDFLRTQLLDLIVDQLDSHLDRLRGGFLQIRIKRRVDAVRLVVQIVLAELADQRVAHHVDEVRRVTGF